jgi:POLQ-like helicase
MKLEHRSQTLLSITRSKAKMFEYFVPEEHHIRLTQDPAKLFTSSIGILGDLSAAINRGAGDSAVINQMKENLLFSAQFFDSYMLTKLNKSLDPYLVLLGSASYYLCDLPGSASVLAKSINRDCPDLSGEGLEDLLLWLLQSDLSCYLEVSEGHFGKFVDDILQFILQFYEDGSAEDGIISASMSLRHTVYEYGTPRQLLFGDVLCSVLKKKLENSAWKSLPKYSGLSLQSWRPTLQKESFIKELWPAQHLLGRADVLKGKSTIIQMPTSAGKTKAVELIIRSAFLAGRTKMAVIIAPFRALCHEIKNGLTEAFRDESIGIDELSDVFQTDYNLLDLLHSHQILVVTPEKLLYVLRHAPDLASHIGLLVFDEGHQFDNGTRGITYELLLTSLKSMIANDAQKVLISAVISNAEAVGEWLSGEPNVVEGTSLIPTFRSVGFASWLDTLGRIEYVDSQNPERGEFFVPRVIESYNLGRKERERKDRFFPDRTDGQSIALYLGLKLIANGSIAVFCGRKDTAASICEKAVDCIERGIPFDSPDKYSDKNEVNRLAHLYNLNLGEDASATQSARFGIFSHHGNIPHGIRLAVENAMRDDLIRFVVCTSTLAQGVNLPIRYLIVTNLYQGKEPIKVRDFHNLIGRAGRSGMHTEGSILFADPKIYDKRKVLAEKWRWEQMKTFLVPGNSEPCISTLLSLFEPIKSDDDIHYLIMESLDFVQAYLDDPDDASTCAARIADAHKNSGFTQDGIERQVANKINLICAIQSFLLSQWDETEGGLSVNKVTQLAERTLAFYLADETKKNIIRELFKLLAESISANITDPVRRKIYGRTLYGVQDSQAIDIWFQSNHEMLLSTEDDMQIIDLIWPLLSHHIQTGLFKKIDQPEALVEIGKRWIDGKPFCDLLQIIHSHGAKMISGWEINIHHIVDFCEGTLAYEGPLLVSALIEFADLIIQDGKEKLMRRLKCFQKRLKYGLPTESSIILYEMGFSDRVIAQDVQSSLNVHSTNRGTIIRYIKKNKKLLIEIMDKYPLYFQNRAQDMLIENNR